MLIVEEQMENGKWVQPMPKVQFKEMHDAMMEAHRINRRGRRARVVEITDGSVS